MNRTVLLSALVVSLFFAPSSLQAQTWDDSTSDVVWTSRAVGIGTSAPATRLHVHHNTPFLTLTHPTTGSGAGDGCRLGLTSTGADVELWNFESGYMRFGTSGIEAMRITANGNLGIGATSASDRLTIQGGGISFNHPTNPYPYVGFDYDPTVDGLRLRANVGASVHNRVWLVMKRETGNVGIGTLSPSDKLTIQGGAIAFAHPSNSVPYAGFDYDAPTDMLRVRTNYNGTTLNKTAMTIARATSAVTIGSTNETGLKLTVHGNVDVKGSITGVTVINATFQDIAEWVPATTPMAAGTVVRLNRNASNVVEPSNGVYDSSVAGVVSAQPGIVLGVEGAGKSQIATTGRVKVKVTAEGAPIRIGDLLVTSGKPGVAMKSRPLVIDGAEIHRPGTIIGKALEDLAGGDGEILVLLSLQ